MLAKTGPSFFSRLPSNSRQTGFQRASSSLRVFFFCASSADRYFSSRSGNSPFQTDFQPSESASKSALSLAAGSAATASALRAIQSAACCGSFFTSFSCSGFCPASSAFWNELRKTSSGSCAAPARASENAEARNSPVTIQAWACFMAWAV